MDSFFVDISTSLSCESYNANPWLILAGLIALIIGVVYIGFNFGKAPYKAFKSDYLSAKQAFGKNKAKNDLYKGLLRYSKPLIITIFLLVAGAYFVLNAVFAVIVLLASNCF